MVLYGFAGYMEGAAYLIASVYWLVGCVYNFDFGYLSVSKGSESLKCVVSAGSKGRWILSRMVSLFLALLVLLP